MNRVILFLVASILAVTTVAAQQPTQAELSTKMAEANMLRRSNKPAQALEIFLWISENSEAGSYDQVTARFAASYCYFSLQQYRESYEMAKSILNYEDEKCRSLIIDQFVKAGMCYAKSVLVQVGKCQIEYVSVRDVLESILPYAKSADTPLIKSYLAYDWYFEGVEHQICAEYEEALECYKQALTINREIGNVKEQLNIIDKISYLYNKLNQPHEALRYLEMAETIAMELNDDKMLISLYTQIIDINNASGDVAKVSNYIQKIDWVGAHTRNPVALGEFYNFKGNAAEAEQRYKLAEQWYLKGVALAQQNPRAANEKLFYFLLANLYESMGDGNKAMNYYLMSLDDASSPNKDNYMTYLHMVRLSLDMGDMSASKSYIDDIFAIESEVSQPRQRYMLYETRASYYFHLGEYELAVADYKFADELLATLVPETDEHRVRIAIALSSAEYYLGNYVAAESYSHRYLNSVKSIYGENNLNYVQAQVDFANIIALSGKVDEGCQNYIQASAGLRDIIKSSIGLMTSAERESFWDPLSELYRNMTPFAIEAKCFDTEFTRACYDALLLSKAFLLDSERTLYDVVLRYGNAHDMATYAEIMQLQSDIKEWENDYIANADRILEATNRVGQLERELVAKMSKEGNIASFVDVDYNAVKAALKPDEVLIDFTDYTPKSSGRRYAAYIVTGDQENPLLKELFAEAEIEALGIVNPVMYYMTDGLHNYAAEVVKLLWSGLAESVGEAKTVYYVPSQLLFQLSLESLPLEDGTLLGDHYNFVRLSSARELVKRADAAPRKACAATLYGGLEYDVDAAKMAKMSQHYDLTRLGTTRGEGTARGGRDFDPLPGSELEVRSVSKILKGSGVKVELFMGANGTEESFINLHHQSPEILHLATHGFFYTPTQAEAIDYLKGHSDAMLLSGLIMSGGNAAWRGDDIPEGVLGGVLTANDIAKLDLSNTDLVVLSACKSGRGDATPEGLYGLQRAFKRAGVNSMIMTLWSVDDIVTQEFMVAFYSSLASNNWDKHKAFKAAKAEVRAKHPEPYHWAAFVMLD